MITFSDNIARKPYLGSTEIAEAWLGNVKVYPDTQIDYSTQYLTFDILQSGNIGYKMSTNTLQYSKNGGATWTNGSPSTNIPVNAGDKVLLKFTNPVLYKVNDTSTQTNGICKFYTDCNFNLYGNIMSLIYGDDFNDNQKMLVLPVMQDNYGNTVDMNHLLNLFFGCSRLISAENLVLPATVIKEQCYNGMFQNCTSLTTAPSVLPAAYVTGFSYSYMFNSCRSLVNAPQLPATTVGRGGYSNMFEGCTNLVNAPQLPATSLGIDCYQEMFYNCTSLVNAPQLPATTLGIECYDSMFKGCTNLVTAPQLPATTLTTNCYQSMFQGCTSLTTAELPATTLADSCYFKMFSGCTALTTAPALPATTLASYCYGSMFNGCTSLTTVPELPAKTLAQGCYFYMFYGCSKLNYIKCLATDISADNCCTIWVNGVAESGTFIKAASMNDWTTGNNGIPTGWTVVDAT